MEIVTIQKKRRINVLRVGTQARLLIRGLVLNPRIPEKYKLWKQ